LRSLEGSSGHVLETVLTIAESLAQRQRDGNEGTASAPRAPSAPAEAPPTRKPDT
jgi:hypothetical protein